VRVVRQPRGGEPLVMLTTITSKNFCSLAAGSPSANALPAVSRNSTAY
jgi:hypothetical protein